MLGLFILIALIVLAVGTWRRGPTFVIKPLGLAPIGVFVLAALIHPVLQYEMGWGAAMLIHLVAIVGCFFAGGWIYRFAGARARARIMAEADL